MMKEKEPAPIQVTFYTKAGCHLCEEARDMLEDIAALTTYELTEIDIRGDSAIFEKYRYRIPVIIISQGPTSPEGDGLAKRLAQGNLLTSGLSSSEESSSDAGYLQERTDAPLIRTPSGHAEPDEGFDPLSLHRHREGEFHPCFDTVGGNPPEFGRSLQNGLPQGTGIAPGGALVSSRRMNAGGSPQGGFDDEIVIEGRIEFRDLAKAFHLH